MEVAEAGTAEEYMQTSMKTAVAEAAAAVTAVQAAAGSDGRKEGTDPKKTYIKKGAFFFNRNPPSFKNKLSVERFKNSPRRGIHML